MEIRAASEPGSPDRANEDCVMVGGDMVVLLDGQTSRTGTGCIHGVAWYVGQLAKRILEHAAERPADALAKGIGAVADAHRVTCDLAHPGTPSAAVAIVQQHDDRLRYLVLGDVTLLIETTAGETTAGETTAGEITAGLYNLCDDRVSRTARAERAEADAHPIGSAEKAQALQRMKHAEQAAKNVPGGFWVAAGDPSVVEHAFTGEAQSQRVALLSDGATRAVTLFGELDWAGLLDLLHEHGPEELIRRVRAVEATDPAGARWPRNKASDDATAVSATTARFLGR